MSRPFGWMRGEGLDMFDARAIDAPLGGGEVDRGEDVPWLLDPERVSRAAALAMTPKIEAWTITTA